MTDANIEIRLVNENFESYQNAVVDIYRKTYSLPPYNESEESILGFSNDWPQRFSIDGFLLVMAYCDGRPVGMAYGWESMSDSHWTKKLRQQLESKADEWTKDNFEFVDFAVIPEFQGKGISRLLYDALFENVPHSTAILYTHQSDTSAYRIYLKKGWEVLRSDLIFRSGKSFVLMGKQLNS